ncbi:CCAAT/enhancer-binding protein zeta isoform X2 [Ornithorhynchus anatinus]|uniref:CCAAT/enhancer-binding protein zeta n=1 Tax=Ornithorhynchus anatinus TaxID=9258 RepID=F6XCZ0_ORNAN|nr:CCAAT/enhancer-binding protein zeta isoform X2 [Ornithorhynchus anatinus]
MARGEAKKKKKKGPPPFDPARPWGARPDEDDGEEEEEDDDDDDDGRGRGGGREGFCLEEVLRLGGTKSDYVMLAALNETEELVDGGKKGTIDDFRPGELEAFVKSLGVSKYADSMLLEDDEQPAEKDKPSKQKARPSSLEGNRGGPAEVSKAEMSKVGKGQKPAQPTDEPRGSNKATGKKDKEQDVFEFCARQTLLIKPGGKWYDLDYTGEFSAEPQDPVAVSKYGVLAQRLYQHETELFKSKASLQKGGSATWMKTIVSSGTLGDRMAAMTLLIQDGAVHTLQYVEILVNLIKKKGSRRQSLMALGTLKDLLISDLLPDRRKLRTFSQRPFAGLEALSGGNRETRDRRLLLWYFEHRLKHLVAEFVQALETLSHDSLAATKMRAISVAHELLCNKPEEEKAFLVQLVNKLGDPQNRIATRASHLLETLLFKHPNMKGVVCGEVERLLYRVNVSPKAQYYSVCFLNQMAFTHEESDLANKLITLYFCFFRSCIKKKDIASKMLSALLTGVNRAYPYAQTSDDKVKEQLDTLFRVLHVVNFNTSVQALMLLFQVMDSHQAISDRYYAALYKKLLDPGLAFCSKQSMFLNLLYKSLKADVVIRRVKAFVKRLLQVTCGQMPSFICGALYLVSEILKVKPGLQTQLQDHPEREEEENFQDVANVGSDDDDDGIEKFTDADKEPEEAETKAESHTEAGGTESASWVHLENLKGRKEVSSYDPLSRNPLFCGADHTSLWELKKLSEHFHPSVALFAKTILQGDYIQYSGDPLQDFTLMRFLDRFVYRNPKQHKGKENTSSAIMQPKKKQFMTDKHSLAVNSKEFLAKEENQIPVDEVFFHRYFKKAAKEKRKRPTDDESVEDVDDDEFERMLDSVEDDNFNTCKNDLDFASHVKKKPKRGKKNKGQESDSEESDDDDDDLNELDDEEVSLGSMDEDFGDEVDEDGGTFMDVLDDENSSGDEGEIGPDLKVGVKNGKRKNPDIDFAGSFRGPKKRKRRDVKNSALFVAAEEFGHLLDENIGSQFDNIGLNALANKDRAHIKQLRWEAERDDWLHDRDVKSILKKKKKKKFKPQGLKNRQRGRKQRK